jgi:hypothetical protein
MSAWLEAAPYLLLALWLLIWGAWPALLSIWRHRGKL